MADLSLYIGFSGTEWQLMDISIDCFIGISYQSEYECLQGALECLPIGQLGCGKPCFRDQEHDFSQIVIVTVFNN